MKKKLIRITTIPYSFDGLLRGQLNYMSDYFDVLAISSDGDGFLQKFGERERLPVRAVSMTRKITPFADLKALWQLYKIFRKERPYIVHSHTPKAGTLGMIAAYFARVPHRLHTIAGLPLLEKRGAVRLLLDLIEKVTYACATKIYSNSFGLAEIILKNGYCDKNKLKVLGNGSSNGIDIDFFNPENYTCAFKEQLRTSLEIAPGDYVFIFIGRIVKDKGINELIRAFDRLGQQYENVKLILVGRTEEELDPIEVSSKNSISGNIKIKTVGTQMDVRPYLAISNTLVLPSYREGFPNVVLEAGAMGLPGIVSNINGCNEIVEDGENGLIVPPKDDEKLYKAMEHIYLNRNKDFFLKPEKIRNRIISKFERKAQWNYILNEYRSLS